ncbi:MAG: tetratricopeptide repeat protein, partial [Thermodesulfobacteriota bacterium]
MKYPTNHFEKGNELLGKKKYEEAILSYEKALKNGRLNTRYKILYNMGIAFNQLSRHKKAVKCYEKVLKNKEYPTPYKAWNN